MEKQKSCSSHHQPVIVKIYQRLLISKLQATARPPNLSTCELVMVSASEGHAQDAENHDVSYVLVGTRGTCGLTMV